MKILSYDVETTSAEPKTCRVCQIAAILIDTENEDSQEHVLNEICDPGMESCDGATAVHGITPADWLGKRPDHVAVAELYDYIERSHHIDGEPQFVIAGHNVKWFDLPILWRLAERPAIFGLAIIDTMLCAQRIYPLAPSHRLTTSANEPDKIGLIEYLGLGPVENAHDAAGDAVMVSRLVRHFCEGLGKTPLQLAAWCGEARVLKYCPFGKHKGKPFGRATGCVPSGYALFIAKNFDPSPDLALTIKHHYGYNFSKAMR